MPSLTLLRQSHPLADPREQVRLLERGDSLARFDQTLQQHGLPPLTATSLDVLQVNVGRLCNQTCRHCHVDAGPDRREIMTQDVMQACLDVLRRHPFSTLDITGGAPEMNPHFRWLVAQARGLVPRIIDRCNLTILLAPGFDDLPQFLAEHRVEIVASLPCYLEQNVDAQRGDGVFVKSLEALRRLNGLGYG
ncbi:MAG: radical SAM protein, partial [Candidatus Saccharimonas sp.]|nr:radical SAM protein [Planctomycetaceae bacterium]